MCKAIAVFGARSGQRLLALACSLCLGTLTGDMKAMRATFADKDIVKTRSDVNSLRNL